MHYRPPHEERLTPEECQFHWQFLEEMGYSRADLLGKHREQIEYQLPGLAEWLNQ
jgi:hypothetical protein